MKTWLRVKALLRRRSFDSDLDEEIRFHLAMRERRNRERGLGPEAARDAATRRFGNVTAVKEALRDMRSFTSLETLAQDFRWAARSLRRSPGFLAAVVLSLALGIGANSTMFSAINAVMFRPLPYPHPDRLMIIWQYEKGRPHSEGDPPIADVVDWNRQNHVFEDIAQTSGGEAAPLTGHGQAEMVRQQSASPNFFRVLGVRPELGRVFRKDEIQDRAQTIVISDEFWARRFNRDPAVLGKVVQLNDVESTVVGVMPPGFAPFSDEDIDVWAPVNPESARYSERKDRGWLHPVARLKPGVTRQQAQSEMDVISRRMEQQYPDIDKGFGVRVVPMREALSAWATSLYPLLGAVGFVLLIACLNVANLLQSRMETRRREQAVRASLGAGRLRLVRQMLTESALLALLGGALGVAFTFLGIRLFRALAGFFPHPETISIDGRVLLFTVAVSLLTALLFGLAPAIAGSRPDLIAAFRAGGSRTVAGGRGRMRHALAIAEVALAMVLLVGAGLMIDSVLRMRHVHVGFDPANVMIARISLPEGGKYVERLPHDMEKPTPQVVNFFRQVMERISALPGVQSVGLLSQFRGVTAGVLGQPAPPADKRPWVDFGEASPSVFATLRIPLKRGRYLKESDDAAAPWAAVINEAFARRFFPHQDPIGQRVLVRCENYHVDEAQPRTVVGVVGDVRFGLDWNETPPSMYTSYLQHSAAFPGGCITTHIDQSILTREATIPKSFASDLKKAVASVDPDQVVENIMSMDHFLDRSVDDTRFVMRLLEIFAGLALLLAIVGIYGVMSYFVNERTHEIGVRIALGAERRRVLRLVTGLGLKLTLIGVVAGAALAVALARLISGFLFGVGPTDPATFATVAAVLICVSLLACYIPACRASRVDPMVALREQ